MIKYMYKYRIYKSELLSMQLFIESLQLHTSLLAHNAIDQSNGDEEEEEEEHKKRFNKKNTQSENAPREKDRFGGKKGKINVNDDLLELVGRRKSNTAEARLNKSIRA